MREIKKRAILEALRNAERPLSVDELSEKVDVPVPRLRMDLYRLQGEGEIESRQEENQLRWTIKVSSAIEKRYEKKSRKYTP